MTNGFEKENTAPRAVTIQDWMILRLSEVIGVKPDQIDPRLPFASFGLDSLMAFNLTGDLAEWLGCDLPATLFWEYPTISTLSEHLVEELGPELANLTGSERNLVEADESEKD